MSLNKRSFSFRLAPALIIFALVAQACDLLPFATAQAPSGPDPTMVSMVLTMTAVQGQLQEANARMTAAAEEGEPLPEAPPATPIPPPSEAPTATNPPPSETPTATVPPPAAPIQPSPIIIVVTATPAAGAPVGGGGAQPKIYARVDSNCRSGPGPEYKRLGYLLVGESSEIYGRNKAWTWWYIREPRRAGIVCWVWGGSTRVEGDTSNTPVIVVKAAPVTKTPSANASFSILGVKMIKCGGEPTVMIRIKNTGNKQLESAALKVTDLTQGKLIFGPSSSNTPFRSSDKDCSAGGDQIKPGQTLYIGTGLGNKSLSGHRLRVELQLCTGEGLGGGCDYDSETYKVP